VATFLRFLARFASFNVRTKSASANTTDAQFAFILPVTFREMWDHEFAAFGVLIKSMRNCSNSFVGPKTSTTFSNPHAFVLLLLLFVEQEMRSQKIKQETP
jgi:hypothetical protein